MLDDEEWNNSPPQLMSSRQYEKHRRDLGLVGHSRRSVQLALASGRIKRTCPEHPVCPAGCKYGRIDAAVADADWHAWSGDGKTPPPDFDRATYMQARTVHTLIRAREARLEMERKAGRLVPRDEVQAEAFVVARAVRDDLLRIARPLGQELAAVMDPREIERRIRARIMGVLDRISGLFVEKEEEEATTDE